ncbi:MAG: ribonuclease [Bacteroidetes bacterium]|nr:ribonuclease [Bacteroidota bacterium]
MIKLWKKLVRKNPHLEEWDQWMRTMTLPGLDGVAVFDVYKFFNYEIKKNSLNLRARAIAFSFFLSLFPAILFVISLVPFILSFYHKVDIDSYVQNLLRSVTPSPDVFKFLWNFIGPILKEVIHKRPSLLTGTFLLTMFLTSNGVVAMMHSFDKNYDHYKRRSALNTRFVALKISMLLVALFIFSLVFVVLGQNLLSWVFELLHIHDKFTRTLFTFIRFISIVLLFFFSISLIYYYGPATKKKYRFISTGSTIATVLSILASVGFSYYLNHYARYSKLYGSIGTVMIILIWFNINAFVLLIGYEINAAIYYHHSIKQRNTEEEELSS